MAPALVWSWHAGQWWVVDHGSSLDAMRISAAIRQAATDHGTNGDGRLGVKPQPPVPGCRFIAALKDQHPEDVWRERS